MSQRANPVIVGGFMAAMIILIIGLLLYVGGGSLTASKKLRYELVYSSSIKGLNVGAPVALKGVKVGEVINITARVYPDKLDVLNSVIVDINPDAIVRVGSGGEPKEDVVQALMDEGLAAKLKMQSLLTGLLYIEVNFYPIRSRNEFDIATEYPQMPTVPSDLEQLTQDLDSLDIPALADDFKAIAEGLRNLVDSDTARELPANLNSTVVSFGHMAEEMRQMAATMKTDMALVRQELVPMAAELREFTATVNENTPQTLQQLNAVLAELENTLASTRETLERTEDLMAPDSSLLYQVRQSAKDVSRAARAVEEMAETLEEKPSALLYGK
ncbi:MlaD family protein [Endozoicomonadaceae bacterium StTr2]